MSEDLGFCRKCGNEIKKGDVFCSKCGTQINSSDGVTTPEAKSNNNAINYTVPEVKKKSSFGKKLLYGIVGIIGIFFVLAIIGAMLPPSSHSTSASIATAGVIPVSNSDNNGTLIINTHPGGADVVVDGVDEGQSISLSLNPGSHKITLLLRGYNIYYGTVDINKSETKTIDYTFTKIETPTESTDVCQWDWTFKGTSNIGSYYTAPAGYEYIIVTIYLKNNADRSVSTNPYYWSLTVDGIKYTPDVSSYSDVINHQTVDVSKGGELETKLSYLVKGEPTSAYISYSGFSAPDMQRINHYPSSS